MENPPTEEAKIWPIKFNVLSRLWAIEWAIHPDTIWAKPNPTILTMAKLVKQAAKKVREVRVISNI